jgi:hypothetical protein
MAEVLTVACWRWTPVPGYRSTYGPETVNVLRRMVARHYEAPHRFVCITDDPVGLDPEVEVVPLWPDFAAVPSPHGDKNPSCYRRLRLYAPDIASVMGPRFVSLDLDCVITGDLRPVWDRPEDIVLWGGTHPTTAYNGSMVLMTAGARPQVWTQFDPHRSPELARRARCYGSDQGWVSYCLGPREARWSTADGVYSFRNDLRHRRGGLPAGARIVMFHGRFDPWSPEVQRQHPWVQEHWR